METRPRVANAPCSWGVLEFDLEGETAGYDQVLDEMAQAGYAGTELGDWGFMPTDPGALRAELKQRGLALLAAFVPVALADPARHAEGEAVAVRTARLLADAAGAGCFIVLADDNGSVAARTQNAGRITPELGLSEAQWQVFAEGADRIAQAVHEQTGLQTVFHHHCAGYVETPAEIYNLLSLTDSDVLGLCLDTGHYMYGGGDPLDALKRYRDRIWHVHFKDCHPGVAAEARAQGWDYFEAVRHGVFCELGQGAVDFPAIVAELRASGYDGWIVVEQDVLPSMGSPLESARRNRAYLASLGL
ncbi:MAG: TIM barrel protein [Anaerolineae bacterium]|nr:TIM barrel protein [Anaerolineae bacterium]